jgi:O-antigen/teichoic acid export membrane protein
MGTGAVVPEAEAAQERGAAPMHEPGSTPPLGLVGRLGQQIDLWRSSPARRASAWAGGQFVASYGLRFVSNVILTHLILDPAPFGVVNICYVVLVALTMFSDIGLGPSIIQHERGEDKDFINTAWTLQVVRGVLLWAIGLALAWPMAWFFGMPELLWLVPVVTFSAVISGFDSTVFWTARRRLTVGRVVIMEFATQVIGTAVTIALALLYKRHHADLVNAGYNLKLLAGGLLVVGAVLTLLLRMLGSHLLLDSGVRHRFRWDSKAAHAIIHFGKWIFLSTFLTFFAAQMDRLLVGKLLGDAALGVYSVGQVFATLIPQLVLALGGWVVFPMLSRVAREQPEQMGWQVLRLRKYLLLPSVAGLMVLVLGGQWLVWAIYPRAFHDGGWVLQILAAGACGMVVSVTYGNAMLAQGRSREITVILSTQIVFLLCGSLLGYSLLPRLWTIGEAPEWAPMAGLVLGFAGTEWLNYPIVAWRARVRGVWNPGLDALIFGVAAAVAVSALYLLPEPPSRGKMPVEDTEQILRDVEQRHGVTWPRVA